jgi:hypothetical protein
MCFNLLELEKKKLKAKAFVPSNLSLESSGTQLTAREKNTC